MAIHLTELDIDYYRGLKDLHIQDLNHINILTGNNNSGKTSVLEVLSSIGSPESLLTWVKMCRLGRTGNYYAGIFNLFPTELEHMEIKFSYGILSGRNDSEEKFGGDKLEDNPVKDSKKAPSVVQAAEIQKIRLSATVHEVRVTENEIERINGGEPSDSLKKKYDYHDAKKLHLEIQKNYKVKDKCQYDIYDFQTRMPAERVQEKSFPVIYVSPAEHTDGKILLDEVMESPMLYQELMKILHEFDNSIINITKSGSGAEYIILSTRHQKAIPLRVYGDGMKKALVLLAAVVKAKDGILLLDEFETAIHTSAMNPIFSWILQSAQRLNVQVFLTSHSLEAIGKVLRCEPQLQDQINLYTLYQKDEKNLVRKLSCAEAIKAQDDWGVELR